MSAPVHLLVVESDSAAADAMARDLGRAGFTVNVSGSVRAAIALTHAGVFDLIVINVALSDGVALDVLRGGGACRAKSIVFGPPGTPERDRAMIDEGAIEIVAIEDLVDATMRWRAREGL